MISRASGSLFVRLLAFAAITLIGAQVISLVLLFKVPAPTPDFYRLGVIAQTYRGQPPSFAEEGPLEVVTRDHPPGPAKTSLRTGLIRAQLAGDLGVPVDDVVIAGSRGPLSDNRVARTLDDRIQRSGGRDAEHILVEPFEVGVRQADGQWRIVRTTGFLMTPWQQWMLMWFGVTILVMVPLAYIFASRLSAPIRLFAKAAERLGRDPRAPAVTLPDRGASEIAVAATAFNQMQERLRRYVEDRTAMVGAIAHDMRTPLTRLRFRIEGLPEDQRNRIAADLDQMEEMITATLAFVRDSTERQARTPLELSSLLESLCDEMAETGAQTTVLAGDKVILEGDPMALRRLFSNLLENAVKFGRTASARVYREGAHAVVEIEDEGPGIPTEDAERVFEPFYRREPSRSRKTGGIGLGLAVVRSIARGHGGDVFLINRAAGGLTARVQLPL